ncbi:polysaccharide pyruvyl transferase family protein [Metabacillus idriensis]|uniref:polysaccharide pyruvyl transferase family protein n=1 Tax=Metabacillus idriensis TaxID=324768 RepID=UPI001748CEF3|nr:polysaccharide pyruvyl transferase family protein [Metabacillus idriensis]
MKIVFVSFIDSTNIGDLLIVKVLEDKLMQEHTVSKYSFNLIPEKNISRVSTEVTNNKMKLFVKNIYNDVFRNLDLIDRLHLVKIKKNIDNNQYLDEFDNDVKNCDLLIIGGGNAIFDLTKHSLSAYKFNKILGIAKKYKKKSFVTSIGIGPFKTQKQIDYTIDTLKNADYITVRDKKSFNYIKPLSEKAHLSIDPVFLLNKLTDEKVKKSTGEKELSICVIDLLLNKDNAKKYKEYISNFAKLINLLSKENYKINLFSTEPRDYRAVNDVYNALDTTNNLNIVSIEDFEDLVKLYSQTDLIIGTRMHSMIIGLSQYIPVIGLSWQDKVIEMFEMVNLSDDVFDINDFEANISNIVKLVSEKVNSDQVDEQLLKIKNDNSEKFDINSKLLNRLFEDIAEEKDKIHGSKPL